MSKGDMIKNDFKEFRDSYSGKRVVRLTAPDHLSHHPYFYNKMITDDNRYLIYAAQKDQTRNLYKMDLTDGTAIQLTEDEDIDDFGCYLTSDNAYLIFCRGQRIIRMDMRDLSEEIVYETPPGWIGYGNPSMSSDNTHLVTVEMNAADKVEGKGDWSTFEPQWARKPCCRIVYIDVQTRTSNVIYEKQCWLGHPQIRPFDNSTILFCHEGPWYKIDARLWLINADGSNLRCAKPQQDGELVTHEYWLSDGSRLAFVDKKPDDAKRTVRFIDPDTLYEDVLMECSDYCHCISNKDNTFIVGDGQLPDEAFIYIIDVNRKHEYKLCYHGTSWKSYGSVQDTHPHPAFSPNSQFIIFTSDMNGMPCIYKVSL